MAIEYCETLNFIWEQSKSSLLGEGAFGTVYLGYCKKSCEEVAVKVYRKFVLKDVKFITRELTALKSIEHPNIISLKAFDPYGSSGAILVTEFCNGGDLYRYLHLEPENQMGLSEEEFLLVLDHLSEGLQYLHEKKIAHRDIKPSNIMRHVLKNGSTVYKIADFGAAKVLSDNDRYLSICGTTTYLHPYVVKAALNRDSSVPREFNSRMDLWSIGVTLYELATNSLPFECPKSALFEIFDRMAKQAGYVSASYDEKSRTATCYKELPRLTRMCGNLKKYVTPLITGLFSLNPELEWNFTQYYEKAKKIVNKQVIKVFYVNGMKLFNIYVDSDDTPDDFLKYIEDETGLAANFQIFFHDKKFVDVLRSIPKADSEATCLFVLDSRAVGKVTMNLVHDINYKFASGFKDSYENTGDYTIRRDFFSNLTSALNMCLKIMKDRREIIKIFDVFMNDYNECVQKQYSTDGAAFKNLKFRVESVKRFLPILYAIPPDEVVFDEENFHHPKDTWEFIQNDKTEEEEEYYNDLLKKIVDFRSLYTSNLSYVDSGCYLKCVKIRIVRSFTIIHDIIKNFDRSTKNSLEQRQILFSKCFHPTLKSSKETTSWLSQEDMNLHLLEQCIFTKTEIVKYNASQIPHYTTVLNTLSSYQKNTKNTVDLLDENEAVRLRLDTLIDGLFTSEVIHNVTWYG